MAAVSIRRTAVVIAALGAAAVAITLTYSASVEVVPEGPVTANVWIDEDGGTCGHAASPTVYRDAAACGPDWDDAWDLLAAGDTARIVDGEYPIQHIDGDKAGETSLIGESKAGVVVSGVIADCHPEFAMSTVFCAEAENMTLERVTLDAGDAAGPVPGSKILADNVTYRNVDLLGRHPDMQVIAADFTWTRGTFGDPTPTPRTCRVGHGEPVWLFGPGATIDRITFNPQTVDFRAGRFCGRDDVPHLELIRLEPDAHDTTLSRSYFAPGSGAGSGYIFTSAAPSNLRIVGNVFADQTPTTWIQASNLPCDALVAYNTILGDVASIPSCVPWVGNLAVAASTPTCNANHAANVWGASGSCPGNAYLGGEIGVDASGRLQAGSGAIDAAETPGADDVCTDPAILGGLDIDGDTRPQGTACDAGADEYSGG